MEKGTYMGFAETVVMLLKDGYRLKPDYQESVTKCILRIPVTTVRKSVFDLPINNRSANAFKRMKIETVAEAIDMLNTRMDQGRSGSAKGFGAGSVMSVKNVILEDMWDCYDDKQKAALLQEIFV